MAAGYSAKGAAQGAERLLRNVEVQALVKQLTDKATAKLGITQDYVLGAIVERLEVARKGDDPYAVYKGAKLPGRHLKPKKQQKSTRRDNPPQTGVCEFLITTDKGDWGFIYLLKPGSVLRST